MDPITPQRGAVARAMHLKLGLIFGTLSFVQGVSEPTTGIVAQPDQDLLKQWGEGPEQLALFTAMLAAPWCVKPLFGLVTDFVPLFGHRRKSYLLAVTFIAAVAMAWVALQPLDRDFRDRFFALLIIASAATAFADVVIDALMIETGKPLGITGRLQSAQFAAIYSGAIIAGLLAGYLSEHHKQRVALAIGAALLTVNLVLTTFFVKEPPPELEMDNLGALRRELVKQLRSPAVLLLALFVFVWSFNPLCSAVLYYHFTTALGLSETIYGETMSLGAVGAVIACLAYGWYGGRLRPRTLVTVAVIGSMVSSAVYFAVADRATVLAVSFLAGLSYMTASMAVVDLAARACPTTTAGTVFAIYMSLMSLSTVLATCAGGYIYQTLAKPWSPTAALCVLIVAGMAIAAACGLLMRRGVKLLSLDSPSNSTT